MNILYILADRGHDLTVNHGYRIHVLKILEWLQKIGNNTFLITINENKVIPDFFNYKSIPHKYALLVHKIVPYMGVVDSLNVFKTSINVHRKWHFDIVHERYGLYSYGGWLTAKILKLPYVLEVNAPIIDEKKLFGPPLTGPQRKSAEFSSKACLRFADHIITVSNNLKQHLVDEYKLDNNKISVLPNAAATELFSQEFDKNKIKQNLGVSSDIIIGYLGTLQPWYGIENLLYAFDIVNKQYQNVQLLIIGDGQARSELEMIVDKLSLKGKITFLGNVEHSRVPELLSVVDIAVAPFRNIPTGFYGSAMKVFEYMAAGKAIVASKIGQIGDVLDDHKTAILVEPGNIDDLAQGMVLLVQNSRLRMELGITAQKEAQMKYSWESYALKLENVYSDVIKLKSL